jgi:protocatechuate 3,4-dioxygenase beta subunit
MNHRFTRREMVENCIVRGTLIAGVPMSANNLFALWQKTEREANRPTPAEVLGPFFKKGAPNNRTLCGPNEPGVPLHVSGKVVNTRGQIVESATIDLWHADHNGHYDVEGYRFRTKITPDPKGEYAIDTVMPGHYPDRPAQHIHYLIAAPGHKTLITQVYFATDPYFEGDPDKNFRKGNIAANRELVRPVMLYEKPGAAHTAVSFDIVLERA